MFLLGTSATPAARAAAITLHYMELLPSSGAARLWIARLACGCAYHALTTQYVLGDTPLSF
jgi:hypothetical protein